jgi:CRP/FNR family transcriptional regulator, cyclic AMP receptor protein
VRALDGLKGGAWRAGTTELEVLGRRRTFFEGEPLLTNGAPGQHAALILGGLVKVTLPGTAGPGATIRDKAGILLSIRGPGELVGEETAIYDGGRPADKTAPSAGRLMVTGLTNGSARVFPAEQLRRFLAEHPDVLWPVAAGLCRRLSDAEARIASAARDNADARLARLLCDLERYGAPDPDDDRIGTLIPLQLSQAELASWIGSCRETVDRTLANWRSRGIISTGYRTIIIRDLEKLARIAGIEVRRQAWRPG